MTSDALRDDDQLDRILAAIEENSDVTVDSTVRQLHAELTTLASDLLEPLPPDPHEEESVVSQAIESARALGRATGSSECATAIDVSTANTPALGNIGPYQLLAKLGQGGMGTVYKALHTKLEKIVALKVLPLDRTSQREAVGRFEREMKAVGQLNHPHIVQAMDAGEADGAHFLVMEYVDGIDLSKLVRQLGPLPISTACELIRQAALGLQAAHQRGMVHRDIKPANLILTAPSFGPPVVKVLDLGLALLADASDDDATGLTRDGHIMGTIDYMAPEQAGDSHAVDIRADIYSLGATLYALVTGGSIFQGRNFDTLLKKLTALATETPAPLSSRRPGIDPALSVVVERMMARDPADRYATPAEVAAALLPFSAEANLAELLAANDLAGIDGVTASWDTHHGRASASHETWRPASVAATAATVPQVRRIAHRRRWPLVAVATALAGIVALAAVLLLLRTPHGEIVVELGDDVPAQEAKQLKIEVRGSGDVHVADEKAGWTIDVKEGNYDVQTVGSDDRFRLDANQVTVARGKKTLLRVSLRPLEEPSPVEPTTIEEAVADVATTPAAWQPTPEQQAFIEAAALLSGEQQVKVVAARLKQVNPAFDGVLKHRLEDGSLVEVDLAGAPVVQLWPLAGIPTLKAVQTGVSVYNEPAMASLRLLPNLSTINDMPAQKFFARREELERLRTALLALSAEEQLEVVIEKLKEHNPGFDGNVRSHEIVDGTLVGLSLEQTSVVDFSPLAMVPWKKVSCRWTGIIDLSPLQGLPLQELNISAELVSDLSPLQGAPLKELVCNGNKVTDITPLKGMPLMTLYVNHTGVADLSPLQGAPLVFLDCDVTAISDLSPLKGMRLQHLKCSGISDLEPLKGMPLHYLECYGGSVSDLSPLKGMPLTGLKVANSRVSDLSPLRGMKLTYLDCSYTPVTDLTPLKGMPLEQMFAWGAVFSDLSPLEGMPLKVLAGTGFARDFAPLRGMPLQKCWPSLQIFNAEQEQILRSCPAASIGGPYLIGHPAAEFWKEFETRRATVESFAAETAKLSADEQIAAVTAKLKTLNSGQAVELTHVAENDSVSTIELKLSDNAGDVSPLRGCSQLKRLTLTGGPPGLDLSPVNSLPLEELICSELQVIRNSSILRAMKSIKTINGQPAGEVLDSLAPSRKEPAAE